MKLLRTLLCLCLLYLPAVQAEDDLWSRLHALPNLDHIQHPRIDAWEQEWRGRSAELRVLLESRGHWLFPAVDAVSRRGLPAELALLPVIESRLNPDAESSSGAFGLWQLRPRTAASLGLKENEWADDRGAPLRATRAALDYLQQLHQRFGGWPLTLAAYNAGPGRVSGALRAARSRGDRADYWNLDLPAESVSYVPRLLGLYRALRDVRGMRLPWIDPGLQPVELNLGGPADLHSVLDSSGIPSDLLYAYNPQFKRWALPPEGPWVLTVPRVRAKDMQAVLTGLPPNERTRWTQVKVRSGDSLGFFAMRWKTSVPLIRAVNGLSDDRIHIGQQLLIPAGRTELPEPTIQAAAARSRLHDPSGQNLLAHSHLVQAGDTLWQLARSSGRSVEQLRRWNALADNEPLHPGQRLRLAPPSGSRPVVHRLRQQESLQDIAARYGVSVSDLRRWNRLGSVQLGGQNELLVFAPQ